MAKQKKSVGSHTKTGRYVIGNAGFAKISAVEGIRLTDAMKERAAVKRAKKLTAEEYRRTIISSHRKG
ncbi:MAG TPA: hypothetical protein VHJ00_06725 [Bradyrhizobium sp.]|jgi:hypothetical protein|nr:hypothetical protein [Bradyrhizobium sp.]